MGILLKEEDIVNGLKTTADQYGGLKNYTLGLHTSNLLLRILLAGGVFQQFTMRYYFVGDTSSHLILQRKSSILNKPTGMPVISSWEKINVKEIKNVVNGKMVIFQAENGQKLRLRLLGIDKSENSEKNKQEILKKFESKLNK